MAPLARVAVTLGDPNGIGPEVVLKALADPEVRARVEPVVVGAAGVFEAWARRLGLAAEGLAVDDVGEGEFALEPGRITAGAGRLAMAAVARACDLCLAGEADAMVTAPISKEAIQKAGYAFPGHTEFLAARTGAGRFAMMLVSGGLRVALVTIHVPLAAVPGLVTRERILETLETVAGSLRRDFGLAAPRVAVLGLNPHAGDGGVIGREEIEVVGPAVEAARAGGLDARGPFAADGFFGRRMDRDVDAVLAMYHDQGLAPFKALAMGAGVNVTCGLPIVRTSPDHGTAFALAGQGVADAGSMREALLLAAEMAGRRVAGDEQG
ncbi:MAG TPA: 4-hydroxythreonine-4-phosphate dehydrogenase PdxA [Rubricoccaceae bacterium]|nr:4-hydroxythreonine-4-phosphate dehydrogenase PdxA [Rubricoccaceae bacterium]